MIAQVKPIVAAEVDEAHRLRSQLLDSFADVEQAVTSVLAMVPKKASDGASLGQRIECAKMVEPNPKLSKANHAIVRESLSKLCCILPLRADVVHARLQVVMVNGDPTVIFSNSRNTGCLHPPVRMIGLNEFAALAKYVQGMADALARAVTQPSPPQPRPAATTGP